MYMNIYIFTLSSVELQYSVMECTPKSIALYWTRSLWHPNKCYVLEMTAKRSSAGRSSPSSCFHLPSICPCPLWRASRNWELARKILPTRCQHKLIRLRRISRRFFICGCGRPNCESGGASRAFRGPFISSPHLPVCWMD